MATENQDYIQVCGFWFNSSVRPRTCAAFLEPSKGDAGYDRQFARVTQ